MLTIKQLLIFHRLWITQLFTYLVTDSATPSFTFCKMIDMPHFVGGTPKMWPITLKFELESKFLYKAPTHHVSLSYV